MTRFAEPHLLETPCCNKKVKQRRFASVNTFGLATAWSDGYTDIFMVSEASRLAYCSGCDRIYWLEDATKLGVAPSPSDRAEHRGGWLSRIFGRKASVGTEEKQAPNDLLDLFVNFHEQPRPADLLLAMLREEWATPERELYLRTRLWWIGNHRQRGMRKANPMTDEQSKKNMLRLLALHQAAPTSDNQMHTVGELLRQLGRFDEAATILAAAAESDTGASAILAAAQRKETDVLLLKTF